MSNATSTQSNDQHSLMKSFLMHVLPGILVTVAFLLLKPLLDSSGYPPLLAFLLAVLLIDIPFMLGVMLNEGKKLNGRFSLEGVVLYREKLSWKTFALVFVGAFVAVYLLNMLATPISTFLTESVFSWLPDWIFLEEQTQYEAYAKNILVVVFTLQLVITGIVLPWVEELYFRGYLMPRISRYGKWAPLLGGLFFGLYHFWQLYGFPTVFLMGVALGYVVWWKRDIRLSISLHIFANVFGRLMFLMVALAM
ncbi:lysostaphin resistance A-like protein [Chloroflexota bacterium]